MERFDEVSLTYEPIANGQQDKCFISTSYDATRCILFLISLFLVILKLLLMMY